MKKTLGSFTAKEIMEHNTTSGSEDGKWTPARPYQLWYIGRLVQAWHVLTLKADALYWD